MQDQSFLFDAYRNNLRATAELMRTSTEIMNRVVAENVRTGERAIDYWSAFWKSAAEAPVSYAQAQAANHERKERKVA